MKFGAVPVAEAEGAILAHTHRLSSGTLKKGRRLDAADLERLAADAHQTVIVARLEPGDVAEDEAAGELAAAAAGAGVRVDAAKTGRSNLFAAHRGVLVVDRAGLERVNLVDAALTIASRAPYQLVEADEMVATVKVIPFAAPRGALSAAAQAAAQTKLRVAPLRGRPAGLILTELPGVRPEQLERGRAAQRARLAYLESEPGFEAQCPHTVDGVKDSLRDAVAAGAEIVLVLGASAIVDPRDVIPEGLRAAGGVVDHVGMPVDPGNLLMLGRLGEVPVLGVPGCARSLKRSGFDAVLERLMADLPVSREDIMRMGAGGLLSEIVSRPAPRLGARAGGRARVGAVVLAAGQSRRMGAANKLLAMVDGRPMVTRVVDALLESAAEPVVVVTGHQREAVQDALQGRAVRYVHNPDFEAGMSTSVKAGLAHLDGAVDGALIALADMPWVRAEHIDRLIRAFDPAGAHSIVAPVYGEKRGNPILWSTRHFAEMRRLRGDVGARHLLEAHHDAVLRVQMPDAATQVDVDTPDALASLSEPR